MATENTRDKLLEEVLTAIKTAFATEPQLVAGGYDPSNIGFESRFDSLESDFDSLDRTCLQTEVECLLGLGQQELSIFSEMETIGDMARQFADILEGS